MAREEAAGRQPFRAYQHRELMTLTRHHGGWVIATSFVLAMILTAMPVPGWALNWRPAWVAMVLIYWCFALPERVGVGVGWILGLLLDVLTGTLLGQNAAALSIVAFVAVKTHQRIRMFPLWQQAILVFFMLLLNQLFMAWVRGIMGLPTLSLTFWAPALTSMLLWPWLFVILRDLRRRYHVT